jgi:hypothetical protein
MSIAVIALATQLIGEGSLVERAQAFLAAQESLSVQLEVSFPGPDGTSDTARGTYADRLPTRHRFVFNDPNAGFETRQDPRLFVTYRHWDKSYFEQPPVPTLVKSDQLSRRSDFAFPDILASRSLEVYAPLSDWKPAPDAPETDLEATIATQTGPILRRVRVLPDGRIAEASLRQPGIPLSQAARAKYSNYGQPSLSEVRDMSPHLPKGYVPSPLPRARQPLFTGMRAPAGRWPSGGDPASIDPKASMGSKGLAVIFCDQDSTAGRALAKDWPQVQKELADLGIASLEVVMMGEDASLEAPLQLKDPTGRLERAFGIKFTPHIFVLDKNLGVFGAWEGWKAGETDQFIAMMKTRLGQLAEMGEG